VNDFWNGVLDLVGQHWPGAVFSLVFLLLGAWWGRRHAVKQWRNKEFRRLNVSLNQFQGGKLRIRTILEKNLDEVFLNRVAVEKVLAAAEKTTEANPLLPLEKDDAWYLLNAVLNEISEQFALGHIRRDVGQPVEGHAYIICLTYEKAGAVRTRKVRAMMVRKRVLLELPEQPPELERASHQTRYQTLKIMAAEYKTQPEKFLEVEICV
jgi:hypothetical protein